MSRSMDWRKYVNEKGDFELATYLYKAIYALMKDALDMGTLLSEDQQRLRAYKEQVKTIFKGQWLDIASALEFFDIIVPCGCEDNYCRLCGGARYRLSDTVSPDQMREIAVVVSDGFTDDPKIKLKLEEGLERALKELGLEKDHEMNKRLT